MADDNHYDVGPTVTQDSFSLVKPMARNLRKAGVDLEGVDLNAVTQRLNKFQGADEQHLLAPNSSDLRLIIFALADRLVKVESLLRASKIRNNGLSETEYNLATKVDNLGVATLLSNFTSGLFSVGSPQRSKLIVEEPIDLKLSRAVESSIHSLVFVVRNFEKLLGAYKEKDQAEFLNYLRDHGLVQVVDTGHGFLMAAFQQSGLQATLNALLCLTQVEGQSVLLASQLVSEPLSIFGLELGDIETIVSWNHGNVDGQSSSPIQRWGGRETPGPPITKRGR